ncbi:TetR/AcrR family transcriptional regulator [Salinibacterium sp. G-O1]|uniref:TetR/AcrR family transcriptional regulator n=1 Tax=Salinibacterium sp. G-O1 TaxID=3046208 RepID=UPI0024B8CEBA|nr:TetR/AcrR family transcriptional regulator [Salinibacterium sp. G-O1]MDJ0333862.1 TetR/AcrR family transcriptional regulator [Salinibacterium sp. G-O1]
MAETWRAEAKAHRRERYLSAAGHLFAQRGYHAVSIDDLGAAVGVSGPALYRHFQSKEAMLIELLVGASERLLAGFEATIAEGRDDLATFVDLIAFHADFAVKERDIIRIQDRELANLPPEANQQVRRLQRTYLEGWQQIAGRLRPELSDADLAVRMHAIFGILNSTPYSADQDAATNVRAVLTDAALGAIFGHASLHAKQS